MALLLQILKLTVQMTHDLHTCFVNFRAANC